VVMVEWDQLFIEACGVLKGKKAKMFKLNKQLENVSFTRGQWVKWEKEILIHQENSG